jgi:acyl dehydratase
VAIDTSCVGAEWPSITVECDARWLMSYAAGIGVADPAHLDTAAPGGIIGHPVFPVAPEWALLTSAEHRMPTTMTRDEVGRSVHAAHDLVLHRPVRPGDTVVLTPNILGVDRVPAGARTVVEVVATDTTGSPVWTTRMTNIALGVEVTGEDRPAPVTASTAPATAPATASPVADAVSVRVPISATAAHVYTECARIWNPIHTDPVVARAAGLPDIVLHGTATLALAVHAVMEAFGVRPEQVRRLGGSFRAPVTMPNDLVVVAHDSGRTQDGGRLVSFEVRVDDGAVVALRGGHLLAV